MGILDITDSFCNPMETAKNTNGVNEISLASNKLHEQPLVSFIEKNEVEEVIYREEV